MEFNHDDLGSTLGSGGLSIWPSGKPGAIECRFLFVMPVFLSLIDSSALCSSA